MNRVPRGCSNIGGESAERLEFCRGSAMKLFASYGYKPFSPSEFQLIESVWGRISPSRSRRLIPIMSPFGEPCVLRGDVTLSAAEYLSAHFESDERPLRLSYADRVFSAPVAPKSNLEENQVGVELIGWEGEGADCEVVTLLLKTLETLSIENYLIVLGDASFVSHLFAPLAKNKASLLINSLQEGSYTSYFQILETLEAEESYLELLRSLPSMKGNISVIGEMMSKVKDSFVLSPLKNLCYSLCKLGFEDKVRVDFSFIRDLGYYSGPIFNAYSSSDGSLLGGGGRYDGLLAQIGEEGEGVGFALNLKELAERCRSSYPHPEMMLWCGKCDTAEALRYADGLCRKGISFELNWERDSCAAMRTAQLRGYKWWADCRAKRVISLQTGADSSLADFERTILSC